MEQFHDVKLAKDVKQFGLKKGAMGAIIGQGLTHQRVYTVEFPNPRGGASTLLELDADAFDSLGEAVVVAGWRQSASQLGHQA
ncbi:MAG: DUF4926 domain-containing protein [Alphaproteobacteria bacterium]|nr:DUF4926 domain-containing protein [Alphaproteobacteria bacterium]